MAAEGTGLKMVITLWLSDVLGQAGEWAEEKPHTHNSWEGGGRKNTNRQKGGQQIWIGLSHPLSSLFCFLLTQVSPCRSEAMETGRWLCLGQSHPALPPVDRADSWLGLLALGPSRVSQAMKYGLKVGHGYQCLANKRKPSTFTLWHLEVAASSSGGLLCLLGLGQVVSSKLTEINSGCI